MNDAALIKSAKSRPFKVNDARLLRYGPNEVECPYCGRYWKVQPYHGTSSVGFIIAAAYSHATTCKVATPEERRAIARHDEKRWARTNPIHQIINNHRHPGFGGVPVAKPDDAK